MTTTLLHGIDLVLAAALALGVYWPRHRRRDLVVAFLGINVSVLAVASMLAQSSVTAGLGLGLFGVLSIIRLRSDELGQSEIAYYFASLALGLVAGLAITPLWMSLGFMLLIVATMMIADSPLLFRGHHRTQMVLDSAVRDLDELTAQLSARLGAEVTAVSVLRIDEINDSTTVDVRYRALDAGAASHSHRSAPARARTAAAPVPRIGHTAAAPAPDAASAEPARSMATTATR